MTEIGRRTLARRIVDFPLVAMVIAIALFVAAVALSAYLGKLLPPMEPDLATTIKASMLVVLVVAVYKLAIVRLGAHPRDELQAQGALKELGLGLLAGGVIFSAVVGVAALLDVYNIVGPGSTSRLVIDLMTIAVIPGVTEEMLFRGILFRWLEQFGGSWLALILTSALFGIGHIMNPNATWFSSFAIAVEAGVLLGGAYMLTRSLWLPIGLHAAWNFTQGFIFDVNVSGLDEHGLVHAELSGPVLLSGGQFGLEASLIALVIATAAGVWFVYQAVQRGEVVQPMWVRRRLEDSGEA